MLCLTLISVSAVLSQLLMLLVIAVAWSAVVFDEEMSHETMAEIARRMKLYRADVVETFRVVYLFARHYHADANIMLGNFGVGIDECP